MSENKEYIEATDLKVTRERFESEWAILPMAIREEREEQKAFCACANNPT